MSWHFLTRKRSVVYTLPLQNPNYAQPKALRTYTCDDDPVPTPCTIWQAARATSAAPTFFKPLPLGQPPNVTNWIDAGMKFNNPSKALLGEAGMIWGDDYGQMNPNEVLSLFLSLGTGFPAVVRLDAQTLKDRISKQFQVPLKAVEVLKSIATDTETPHTGLVRELSSELYHRFNVEQGLQEVELFEYEKLEGIQVDTENYLTQRSRDLTTCVLRMAKLTLPLAPLEERPDTEEHFGTTGDSDDANLHRRLAALKM
jgi:hypothetical protein